MPDLIIEDNTPMDVLTPPGKGRGLVERDYAQYPAEMFAPPSQLQLIPRSEWSDRIKEQERLGSSLEHIRDRAANGQPMPSLDQGPVGYCWAHSTTHTVMLSRAANNLPYVPLSAYAVAATLMQGRDQGAWCGLSAKFAREKGIPSQALWPQGDRNYRSHDQPDVWADAAKHKVTEDWVDLTRDVYDQNLTFDQVATCLLTGVPVAVDFNWWSHSVCAIRLVEVEPGSFGLKILNSWSDQWGDRGTGILRGQRAIPDGAIATRVTVATA